MAWGLKRVDPDRWTTWATGPAFILYSKITNPSEEYPAAVRLVISEGQTQPPSGVTVTSTGEGATTYRYGVSAVMETGETTPTVSSEVTGIETLDAEHPNRVTWDPVPGALGYRVYQYVADRVRSASVESGITTYDDIGGMTDATPPKHLNETAVKGADLYSGYVPPSSCVDTEGHERFFLDQGESLLIWSDRADIAVIAFGMVRGG